MNTALAEKIAHAETLLGCELPPAYRDYLLDPDNADSEIVSCFLKAQSGKERNIDWGADFPYTVAHQPTWVVPSFASDVDFDAFSDDEVEEYYDTLTKYLDENYAAPAGQGSVFINEEGCVEFSILILRGPSRGQVWRYEITYEDVAVTPRYHPVTKDILHFDQWLELQRDPCRLTSLTRKQAGVPLSFSRISREGKIAMRYHLARNELRGIDAEQIGKLKKVADIPEDAEFLDPYTGTWESVRAAIPVWWAQGITLP